MTSRPSSPCLSAPRQRPGGAGLALGLAGLAMPGLHGCSSTPPTAFHTLMAGGAVVEAPRPDAAAGVLAFRIDPVHVPAQADRPQWVLREPSGDLRVLEQQRWAAPLADEWRAALGAALSARLGALDLTHVGAGAATPSYRVQLDVQRFDTVPGRGVRDDAVWTITAPGATRTLTCRSAEAVPAVGDYAALAAAHRHALDALAAAIAQALQALQADGTLQCPA